MKDFLATPMGKFVRVLLAAALASIFTAAATAVTTLPVDPLWIPTITAALMGFEDYLRKQGWLTPSDVQPVVTTTVKTEAPSSSPTNVIISDPSSVTEVKTKETTPTT